jgi:hypothetical protein
MVVPGAKTSWYLIGRLLQLPVIRNLVMTVTKDSISTRSFFFLDTSEMGTWLFTRLGVKRQGGDGFW